MRKRNVWPANEKQFFSFFSKISLSSAKHFVNSHVWTPAVRESFSRPKVLFIIRVRGGGGGRAFLGSIHGWKLSSGRLACQCRHHATFMLKSFGSPEKKVALSVSRPRHFFPALKKCGLRPAKQQKWTAEPELPAKKELVICPTAAALH